MAGSNVLDPSTWEFCVVPTKRFDQAFADRKTISLGSVQRVGASCGYAELKARVDEILRALLADAQTETSGN